MLKPSLSFGHVVHSKAIALVAIWIMAIAVSYPSAADNGLRMVRIQCDRDADQIAIEPFILWNGETHIHGVTLEDPEENKKQVVGHSTYYYVQSAHGDESAIQSFCKTVTRVVDVRLKDKQLAIQEMQGALVKNLSVDFEKDIESAWDVYGPAYSIRSVAPGKWEGCSGREEQKNVKCLVVSNH